MRYIIDKSVIGNSRHLLYDGPGFHFTDYIDPTAFHVVKSGRFLDLVKLSLKEFNLDPPQPYIEMMKSFRELNDMSIPWQQVMPTHAYKSFLDNLTERVDGFLNNAPMGYLEGTWDKAGAVFTNLKRLRVNKRKLKELIDAKDGNFNALHSFIPTEGDFAPPIVYNRHGTSTGRLTIKSGPQIHTLSKKHRHIIESMYGDEGEVCMIDFNALEPRVILYEAGLRCEERDLYVALQRELNCTRNQAKAATIPVTYGAGLDVIKQAMDISDERAVEVFKIVKQFFGFRSVAKRVKQEFVNDGYVTSRFGRRITVDEPKDHVIFNHFVQATGADVALLAFAEITEKLKETAPKVRPLCLIHDALLLDSPKEDLVKIDELLAVKVSTYVQKFYLKRTGVGG